MERYGSERQVEDDGSADNSDAGKAHDDDAGDEEDDNGIDNRDKNNSENDSNDDSQALVTVSSGKVKDSQLKRSRTKGGDSM